MFFGRIMKEHAMFIRGLLDPCETELINTADGAAREFAELMRQCRIRSVILPLLADHVLREANHYIRLLRA